MRKSSHRAQCSAGLHRPRRIPAGERGVQRSTCLDCNCGLMRTAATRRWYLAGMLA